MDDLRDLDSDNSNFGMVKEIRSLTGGNCGEEAVLAGEVANDD
jgi:hypothetical protein